MRFSRITKLRFRVFRDFSWPSDLHKFAQFNVIYGWNGSGKTTLSSLFSLIEKRTPLIDGDAELEIDDATKVASSTFASSQLPQVRVFNRDFINATLSQTGGIAPIYFLGEDSIEKQTRIEQLRTELTTIDGKLQLAQVEKIKAESGLDDFCKERAKQIKTMLTTANSTIYNNYDKRNFRRAIEAKHSLHAAVETLSDARKTQLLNQKNSQPKPLIEKVSAPEIKLDALTREVDTLVARSVIAQTLDELTIDSKLAAWVQEGLHLHSGDHTTDTCRFCFQPLEEVRRRALEAHFNDAFAILQKDLTAVLSKLKSAKKATTEFFLPDFSRFYEALASEVRSAQAMVLTTRSKTEAILDTLIARVDAKRNQPFAPNATQSHATTQLPSISESITEFNSIIERHNQISADFSTSVEIACKNLEESYVAESHAEFVQLSDAMRNAAAELDSSRATQTEILSQINELERTILEHRRPADELTEELRAYLGRDELKFDVNGIGYALTRNGHLVSHLSDGERTAIAFLYFLKSLQDRAFDLRNSIVVIDDPVSSLDDSAMFSAFGYMKDRTKEAGQLIILTHSFAFFRMVKNWFHNMPKQKRRRIEERPARFFLLRTQRHPNGSRTSKLGHLDSLLEEYESEYQYLFKRVYEEAHRDDVVQLEHHYGLPNVARRLIEAFLAFRFPDIAGDLYQRLERVDFDNAKKTRILRLLNTYSHASAINDPGHDLSLLAETQPVLLDILDMMKAVDIGHYEGLLRLVNGTSGSEQALAN